MKWNFRVWKAWMRAVVVEMRKMMMGNENGPDAKYCRPRYGFQKNPGAGACERWCRNATCDLCQPCNNGRSRIEQARKNLLRFREDRANRWDNFVGSSADRLPDFLKGHIAPFINHGTTAIGPRTSAGGPREAERARLTS